MSRVVHSAEVSRSARWLRVLINKHPHLLAARLSATPGWPEGDAISWFSPLESDQYAEYRDESFLDRLGIQPDKVPLASFWPRNGPCWDALGTMCNSRPLLVEAKAYIEEAVTTPCAAGAKSVPLIRGSLNQLKGFLRSSSPHDWSSLFYQYTNRLAHLYFLRELNGIDAYLIFVYFAGAPDVPEPSTEPEWRAANRLLKKVLGLGKHHRLSPYIADVHIDVAELTEAESGLETGTS